MTPPQSSSAPNTDTSTAHPLRKRIILFLKVAFVFSLLYFLAKKGLISIPAMQQALKQWDRIIPALAVMIFSTGLGVLRWQWLLKAHAIDLEIKRTAQLSLIGIFFNLALPGAVSGDFVKAFYIGKEIKGQRSKAFGSILFDRVAGLSALVCLSATALLLGYSSFSHSPLLSAIQYLITLAAIGVVLFYGYLFTVHENSDPLLKGFRWLETKAPQGLKISSITRIYEGLRHYHNHRITVIKVLLLSIVIHLMVGWACFQIAQALDPQGLQPLSLLSIYVIVPLGMLVTAIPVAPAGVGTGNVAFLYFFSLIHYDRGADVYSLLAMMNILIGCFGGLVYFRFKSFEELPDAARLSEA